MRKISRSIWIIAFTLLASALLLACAKSTNSDIVEIEFYQQKSEIVEIIDTYQIAILLDQPLDKMRADKTGPTGYQNAFSC